MRSEGFEGAVWLPIPQLLVETKIVEQRKNEELATYMSLLQLTISSVMSTKARREFKKQIEGMVKR